MTLRLFCGPNSLTFVRPESIEANQVRAISSGEEYFSFVNYMSSISPACSSFSYLVQTTAGDTTIPAEILDAPAQPEFLEGENRIHLKSESIWLRTISFFIRITEAGGYTAVDGPFSIQLICGEATTPVITQPTTFAHVQDIVMR